MAQRMPRGDAIYVDREAIGWWIEGVDEKTYGPVSWDSLRRFVAEGIISPNTTVRHCAQPDFEPVADQLGLMEGLQRSADAPVVGDLLEAVWPRRKQGAIQLAAAGIPCVRHERPAVLFCTRCHAPYCHRCRAKPLHRQFFWCRRCQASNHNRRFLAYIGDAFVISVLPGCFGGLIVGMLAAMGTTSGAWISTVINIVCAIFFIFRDVVFSGAGPGKRCVDLKVVRAEDGKTPLGYGAALLRWLSLATPLIFVEIFVSVWDPQQQRIGDRWAGTRVVDLPSKLAKARRDTQRALLRKGFTLVSPTPTPDAGVLPLVE